MLPAQWYGGDRSVVRCCQLEPGTCTLGALSKVSSSSLFASFTSEHQMCPFLVLIYTEM